MHTSVFRRLFIRFPVHKQIKSVSSVSSDVNDTINLKQWTQIPGPKSYPIIGSLLNFLPGGELRNLSLTDLSRELYAKYGPIVKIDKMLDRKPMIFLFDAESASHVLRAENHWPIRTSMDSLVYYRKTFKNTPPDSLTGLITEQGKSWQEFRSTVNPVLMQPKTMRLYTSVIDEVTLEFVERIKSLKDYRFMIPNLDREIKLWSMESIGVIALGCRLKCFDNNLDKDSPVQQLIEVVQNMLKISDDLDYKPSIWKYYPTKLYRNAMEYYEKQEILSKHFIDQAIREFEANPKPDDQKGILEKLLNINKEVALIMASDMLVGGVDTVTNAVLGALYLLASNPDKQSKLREELKTNEGNKPYLKACIIEALRKMPVTLGNKRETTKEHSILGYKIPKGIDVIIAHQEMANMDKYFLKADEYIPERWIVDKDDSLYYRHPFAYNPFGFGARTCIGRRIAELEMESLIGRIIENFEIGWFGLPPKVVKTSINYVKGPYNYIFKDVKN